MVFSSAVFLFVFLPLTLLFYYLLGSRRNSDKDMAAKNLILCIASLIFYAWGEPVYIVLMLISIVFNYNIGMDIEDSAEKPKKAKALLVFSLIFNLAMLGFFKYAGFFAENIAALFGFENRYEPVALPIGISFYTFQIISYVVDVYRKDAKAQRKIIPFACYISMFPQLIAGPIVQYSDIEKQLGSRTVTPEKFYDGIIYFIRGLGKKVLFANTVGAVYSGILADGVGSASVVTAWLGILCYTLQIYFDFSGYSDMAVGLGKMFGFEFVRNFNFPYKATSITDFWRRWHISLSSWFRDYVYIPLGGNRKGTARTVINILIVWSLTGLWHGADWNFIVWGMFYGVLLIAEKYPLRKLLEKTPTCLKYIGTMITVMIGWVFFSSSSLSEAFTFISSLFAFSGNPLIDSQAKYLLSENAFSLVIMILGAVGVFDYVSAREEGRLRKTVKSAMYLCIFVLCVVYLISDTYNPFLYFRF
ncbi:MAG: MBOAT family protein [Oscillospiraceae bacterium]|nr:MBOAT family protein [Oscillospiraceae bacterium]